MIARLLLAVSATVAGGLLAARRLLRSRADDQLDEIDLAVVATTVRFRTRARPFLGGTVLVVAGTAELDLRRAHPAPTGIEIAITAVVGHLRLVIPPEWNLEVRVNRSLSLLQHQHAPAHPDAPWLRLIGRSWLARVEVVTRSAPVGVA